MKKGLKISSTTTRGKLPDKKYDIIYADPPWDYGGQTQYNGSKPWYTNSVEEHYPTMKINDLKDLDVASLAADDCLLFLWATSPHLSHAIEVAKIWGFDWATVAFVWHKQRPNAGFYTMSECELCLVFKKGRIPKPRGSRNTRQFLSEKLGQHSAKPEEVRKRIDAMFPTQSKIELFARKRTDGWDTWGDEV